MTSSTEEIYENTKGKKPPIFVDCVPVIFFLAPVSNYFWVVSILKVHLKLKLF